MARRKRKADKDRFTMRLPPELRAQLEERAKADGRPLANYVRRLFEAHVAPVPDIAPRAAA